MNHGVGIVKFDYLKAYESMYLIRRTEEEIVTRYSRDEKMRCPTHLSIGQESSAVGVAMALKPKDHVYCYHRCHAHYLAKGGDLTNMIDELHGKASGSTGGWGGSMHLVDEGVYFTEAATAVGDSVALAVGAALAYKLDGSGRVAVSCFGDSTVETGQFWESVNFAALHRLPIMFVCENNMYSTATPISQRQPEGPIHLRLQPFMWTRSVDDGNVEEVYQAAEECRNAQPGFLEISTYRYREHVGPNYDWDLGYRTKEEVYEHMASDTVKSTRNKVSEEDAAKIEHQVDSRVLAAFEHAEAAAWPEDIKI
jgi:TPP-dependent pyruvate/acetoin dehydrogenase alpha subunit